MLFTLVCVLLLLAVLAAIGLPLLSGAHVLPTRGQYDRAVYRDQLREVDRDLARGVLTPIEADAARLEIQRRLLAVDVTGGAAPSAPKRSPRLAAVIALFVLLTAGGLYWRLGAPALPDVPFASRSAIQPDAAAQPGEQGQAPPGEQAGEAPPRHADMKQAAAKLEQKLLADPSNAAGWVLYARTQSMLGDWDKAANAYKRAIDLGQKGGDVLAGYGEMLVLRGDGIVSPAAHDAFAAALAADQSSGVARYYLALADSQAGEEHKAIDAWVELAAGLPEDSPMRDEIAHRIVEAAKNGGFDPPPMPKALPAEAAQPGPTPDQMDAAAAMPPAERDKMIRGMVEQLAAKLQAEPNDLEGWMRLGGAYAVLGLSDKAVAAFDRAAALKPDDPAIKLRTVAALLSGMKPGEPLPPRAVTLLNEVAAVAPDAPEVLWYLGVAAARDGRREEARDKWTKLLASLPADGDDAKMVKAALEALPGK
jgi:cytochrome c-type biogenesis protein CcmH